MRENKTGDTNLSSFAKLKEIESVLSEEITPTLTRLNEERSSYLEYQKVLRELDHLTKLHVAYQFVFAEKLSKESEQELAKLAEATNALRQRLNEIDGVHGNHQRSGEGA